MDQRIRTVVALDTGVDSVETQRLLAGVTDLELVGVIDGIDETWRTLQDSPCDLLLIACQGYSERALFLVDGAYRLDPTRPIVVLSQGSPNGFMRRAFEAGAEDILMLPQTSTEDVGFAVRKVLARRAGGATAGGASLGRLVCVLGPKGGTGKTLTACNLAVSLAEAGERVALVDLDLQFGDVALTLGLAPDTTIHDLANVGGTLDADKLDAYLATHASGARVLLAPTRPDQASVVTTELMRDVYSALRGDYEWVIVDTPPGFTAEVIASIDASSDVVMVGMLDSLSLKNTKLGLETLGLMGYNPDRITLVLNRAHSRVGISQGDVAAILGRVPDVFVPSDREVPRTVNEGVPIVTAHPDSEPALAFKRLAARLNGGVEATASAPLPVEPQTAAGEAEAAASPTRFRLFGRKK